MTVAPPVRQLAAPVASADSERPSEGDRPANGVIEVELRSGVKLRLTGTVDVTVLRQVLSALS